MSKESLIKYRHRLNAEQSVHNFIKYLEEDTDPISEEDKEWLLEKGREIFDAYYVDHHVNVTLSNARSKENLEEYFDQIQTSLGKMFGHILLLEFKLYLFTNKLTLI